MRYTPTDIPALVRTPVGRGALLDGLEYRLWPVAAPLARGYRQTLARGACVVAVVGSLGKTTAARTVEAALHGTTDAERRDNSFCHVARRVFALAPRGGAAVVEVGIDRPGQMAAYARLLRPDVTVVTSVASDHQPYFGTLEAIQREKEAMVAALPAGGLAVLNGDDERVRAMASATLARSVTFGIDASNDVRARDVVLDWPHGMRFVAEIDGQTLGMRIRLLGVPGVRAALAALALAHVRGVDLETVAARLAALPPTPMRLAPVALTSGAFLLRDEFKATRESVDSALELLASLPARRRFAVLGDALGPPGRGSAVDPALVARVGAVCDRALLVGENAEAYADALAAHGVPRSAIVDCHGRMTDAIDVLRSELREGDIALLKGRDWQRLERIAAGLLGRRVSCELERCDARVRCEGCGMLERGWNGRRKVDDRNASSLVE